MFLSGEKVEGEKCISAQGSSVKGSSQQGSTSGPKVKGGGPLFSGQGPLIMRGGVGKRYYTGRSMTFPGTIPLFHHSIPEAGAGGWNDIRGHSNCWQNAGRRLCE